MERISSTESNKENKENNFKTPVSNLRKKSRLSDSPLVLPPSPFMKKLGYGTGVKVLLWERGSEKGKSPWAVKKISRRLKRSSLSYETRLKQEADILRQLNHPNIIQYKKFGRDAKGTLCLVMESGESSLDTRMEARLDEDLGPFPADAILRVATGLANALDYLHNEHHLLHGDIKSGNVLVTAEDCRSVKLCDFGVSVKLLSDLSGPVDEETCFIGSEPWTPPETMECGVITDRADIFPYGLVLWEMFSLTAPHVDQLDCSNDDSQCSQTAYYDSIGKRPALPRTLGEEYNDLVRLFVLCTNEDPQQRPTARMLVQAVLELDITCPKNPASP